MHEYTLKNKKIIKVDHQTLLNDQTQVQIQPQYDQTARVSLQKLYKYRKKTQLEELRIIINYIYWK